MMLSEEIECIHNVARYDRDAAIRTAIRFVLRNDEYKNKHLCARTTSKALHHLRVLLLRAGDLREDCRKNGVSWLKEFGQIEPVKWIFRADRKITVRVQRLVNELFGVDAALWTRFLLHCRFPRRFPITRRSRDRLAHLNVVNLPLLAEIRV